MGRSSGVRRKCDSILFVFFINYMFPIAELPVVNCEWLLLCAKAKRKMPMRPFLVGASVAPQGEPAVEEDPDTGPITSTANPLLGLDRPANMPNDVSPIRSVEKPESSVDRLKRQRPDEFATPQTPVLKHRRLSELGAGYASGCNSPMLTQSPQISVDEMMKGSPIRGYR